MRTIILASASPNRRKIFERLGIPFTVEESGYEEDMTLGLAPRELVQHLALGKAQAVAARHPDALVIGADTVVVLDGKVFGKPDTPESAREMLRKLSGTMHVILTGLALVDAASGTHSTRVEETRVTFRALSDEEITAYIESGESFGRSGAYAIQGGGMRFVEKIEGDIDNAAGLPLAVVREELEKFGVSEK